MKRGAKEKKKNESLPLPKIIAITSLIIVVLLIGLSYLPEDSPFLLGPSAAVQCDDGIDNDRDGLIDWRGPPPFNPINAQKKDPSCANLASHPDECVHPTDTTLTGTPLFSYSGDLDAHIAPHFPTPIYPYTACYDTLIADTNSACLCGSTTPGFEDLPTVDCADPNANPDGIPKNMILRVSGASNAHVELPTETQYIGTGIDICVGSMICEYVEGSCDTGNGYECVGSLPTGTGPTGTDTNLHVGHCETFPRKICCIDSSSGRMAQPRPSEVEISEGDDDPLIDTDTDAEGRQIDLGNEILLSVVDSNLVPGHSSWGWVRVLLSGGSSSGSNSEPSLSPNEVVLISGGSEAPQDFTDTPEALGEYEYFLKITYAGEEITFPVGTVEVLTPPDCRDNNLELNRLEVCDCGPDGVCGLKADGTTDDLVNGHDCTEFDYVEGPLLCGGVTTETQVECKYFDTSACLGCGDGIKQTEYFEECDDGNKIGGDGCSADCKIDWICPYYPQGADVDIIAGVREGETVAIGNYYIVMKSISETGSSVVVDIGTALTEEIIEEDVSFSVGEWKTASQFTMKVRRIGMVEFPDILEAELEVAGAICGPTCGNNVKEKFNDYEEQCDDGNNINGDGCSNTCSFTAVGTGGCEGLPLGAVSSWTGDDIGYNPPGSAHADIAFDSIGNNDGDIVTNTGGQDEVIITSGLVGNAFNFDDLNNEWISIQYDPNTLALTSATMEAWVNPTTLQSYSEYIFVKKDLSGFDVNYGILINDQGFTCNIKRAFNSIQLTGGPAPILGKWHHVACAYDEITGTGKLYVDGIQADSKTFNPLTAPHPLTIAETRLFIGGDPQIADTKFNGLIDEVTLYDRELVASEIQGIFEKGGAGKCTPLNSPLSENPPEPKNRYISFFPNNLDEAVALRVTLKEINIPGSGNLAGQTAWVGEPKEVCETSTIGILSPGQTCTLQTYKAAQLTCDAPVYRVWDTTEILNVFGSEIVPNSVYEVQAVREGCDLANPNCFSPPTEIITGMFGDVVGSCTETSCSSPDGEVEILDALAGINAFSSAVNKPRKVFSEIENSEIDHESNIGDILQTLRAFSGLPYAHPIESCGPDSIPEGGAASSPNYNTQDDIENAVRTSISSIPAGEDIIVGATIINNEVHGTGDACGKVYTVDTDSGAVTESTLESTTSSCSTPVAVIKRFFRRF